MSDNLDNMTPEERLRHLREHGKSSACDVSSNSLIDEKPSWFDETRWLLAREAVLKYEIGIAFSSFSGLLLILQLPEGLEPLLSTGNSKDIPSLFQRYLATVLHVKSWYTDDIFDPSTKGYKSIRQVRGMHKRVSSIMNERFKVPSMDGNKRYWFNHYDVALTQFSFIGLAMSHPEKSGLIAASPQELEGINYYWRVLGHLMGVRDEFNACCFDKYEDILKFNKLILQHEFLDNFNKLPCEKGLQMTKSICLAMQHFVPLLTFNSLAHWWKDVFKFNGYEPQPMTAKEKVLNFINRVSFNHLLRNESFLRLSTKLHNKSFDHRLKSRDKVCESLKKKYKGATEHTFYSDRIEYFTKGANETSKETNKVKSAGCPFGYETVLPPASLNETVTA